MRSPMGYAQGQRLRRRCDPAWLALVGRPPTSPVLTGFVISETCMRVGLAMASRGLGACLPGGVEHLPDPAGEASPPERGLDAMLLVRLGNGGETHHLPRLLLEHVADQIVLVQPLHRALALVVQPAVE